MKYNYGRPSIKRPAPYSVRLSSEQRAALEEAAGDRPLAAYIKSLLFANGPPPRARTRAPVKDTQALAELLACLGASRIPNNLNQLAKAANSGSLHFDWQTKAAISAACEDIRAMRQLLMKALGMKLGDEAPVRESPSQGFVRVASEARR